MARVTFTSHDTTVEVPDGTTLLAAAHAAGVDIVAPCGGSGSCGRCKVRVERGAVAKGDGAGLSEAERAEGFVLACHAEAFGDVDIHVPMSSRLGSYVAPEETDEAAAVVAAPPVRRVLLQMTPPDLTDTHSDVERVKRAVTRETGVEDVQVTWRAVHAIPSAARDGDWTVTALVLLTGGRAEVLDVEPGDVTGRQYAMAIDLGTTTVACELVDLVGGVVLGRETAFNAQASCGSDVISRIIEAGRRGGLERLQNLVLGTVRDLTARLLHQAGASADDVILHVFAGNTTMTHLLFGVDPSSIRIDPFVPAATSFPWMSAAELGLTTNPVGQVWSQPSPASYVGGDIVAGVLVSGLADTETLTLLIDVGTNGEIVLGSNEWMVSCSCSAGPAFEGGGVKHGMRATAGAIEDVSVDPETFEPSFNVIGDVAPKGICGSGLVDLLAELFLTGVMDPNGKLTRTLGTDRVRETESGWEYVVAYAEPGSGDHDVVITESDIDNLLRAKAAVFAGIRVLLGAVGLPAEAVERVFIAGGFGRQLKLDRAVTIGLLPDVPLDRFHYLGNTSLQGARKTALAVDAVDRSEEIAKTITYMDLSVSGGFMDEYVSALFLPHTDVTLFPSLASSLSARNTREMST